MVEKRKRKLSLTHNTLKCVPWIYWYNVYSNMHLLYSRSLP